MRGSTWLLPLTLLLGAPVRALAQPADAHAEADALFEKGREAQDRNDCIVALPLFRKSQALEPGRGTQLNIALCEEEIGLLATSLQHFQELLPRLEGDGRIEMVKGHIAALGPRIPHLKVDLATSAPPGTTVTYDDAPLAPPMLGSDMPVNPGRHVIIVHAPGLVERRYKVALKEGAGTVITVRPGWVADEPTDEADKGSARASQATAPGETPADPDPRHSINRNMIGVSAHLDIMNIASKTDVCSPAKAGESSNYVCFLTGKSTQFDGAIAAVPGTNGLDGGLKFLPGVRILASYDRQLLADIPLTIGARFGVAIGGSPTPDNKVTTDPRTGAKFLPISHQPAANSFFPLHYELRAALHFGGSMLDDKKFRPYAFIAFGGGEVAGAVPLQVCDTTPMAVGDGSKCKGGPGVKTTVDAYQIAGLNFIGFGGGTTFGITPNFGVGAELEFMLMVPTFGFVTAPSIGPVFAF